MSTNAKAWDQKAGRKAGQNTQQYDSQQQNTGKCDNCRYRVSKQERIHYDCAECGSYIVSTSAAWIHVATNYFPTIFSVKIFWIVLIRFKNLKYPLSHLKLTY